MNGEKGGKKHRCWPIEMPSLSSNPSLPSFPPSLFQELVLKTHDDPTEFLGMLGGLGALLAGTQALFIEWGRDRGREGEEEEEEEEWGKGLVYILGFAVTLATMYTLTARFLREVSESRGGREGGKEEGVEEGVIGMRFAL